jgi:hypothetical protein
MTTTGKDGERGSQPESNLQKLERELQKAMSDRRMWHEIATRPDEFCPVVFSPQEKADAAKREQSAAAEVRRLKESVQAEKLKASGPQNERKALATGQTWLHRLNDVLGKIDQGLNFIGYAILFCIGAVVFVYAWFWIEVTVYAVGLIWLIVGLFVLAPLFLLWHSGRELIRRAHRWVSRLN